MPNQTGPNADNAPRDFFRAMMPRGLIAPRDLGPISAAAAAAFLALAIFAWMERTVLVDPEQMSVPYWPWKLWQIGPLLMGFGGVWWLWLSTRHVPWVRSLALGIMALVVLANGYTDLFGNHWGNVWRTVNPLFIGSFSVAAVAQWRCGSIAGRVGAIVSAALGALVFANGYFIDNGVIWQILNPVRMLTALAWAAGANQANLAALESGESSADGWDAGSVHEGVRRLAAKWCAEPSVHGGKARPKTTKLVV